MFSKSAFVAPAAGSSTRPAAAALAACAAFGAAIFLVAPVSAQTRPGPAMHMSRTISFMATLHDGRVATVYNDGRIIVAPPPTPQQKPSRIPNPRLRAALRAMETSVDPIRYGLSAGNVPASVRRRIVFDLEHPPTVYVANRVVLVLKPGAPALRDVDQLDPTTASSLRRAAVAGTRGVAPHAFTTDARTNATLFRIGVDRMQRLFTGVGSGAVGSLRARAESSLRRRLLPFENAYVLHVTAASVRSAVQQLRSLSTVAYAAPDRTVGTMISSHIPIPAASLEEFANRRPALSVFGRSIAGAPGRQTLPTNTSLAVSQQAMLNAPGTDAAAAFDEIARVYDQLPGTGEIVTNVSLGDADDASAANDPNDPCSQTVAEYGGTTHVIGGQRYLDWPGMPRIPVWVADANAHLSGSAEVCNVDPALEEVGLDFSVMAALPDAEQRAGEAAPAGADLLGIAPGASYRLVLPEGNGAGVIGETDILAAFIAAATQAPAPNVITASIGFGLDSMGFPGRYLEDDPLSESVVASIVNATNVVVCISANDGTRTYTHAMIGPSGGSAPTNVASNGAATDVDDLGYSTAPSFDLDSGAIDVGASTLDDIIAANPSDPANVALANTKAFVETRFDGMLDFSSGFGSRVSISAPGDNIGAYAKAGPAYDATGAFLTGGTSAAAPEVAAAAAVVLQVARLTGHPFARATDMRSFLQSTGTPVATPPQSDVPLNIGPQVSVRRAVEQLLAQAGHPVKPGIARVAVQGRRSGAIVAQDGTVLFDSIYQTGVDPSFIKLDGPWQQSGDPIYAGTDTGAELHSYLTIAPDWEGLPAGTNYRLFAIGHPSAVVATTPYVRLLPAQLLKAAGVPLMPGVSRTVGLTYQAMLGLRVLAQSTFQLTFGPPASTSRIVFAPQVPAVVTGGSFNATYDLSSYPSALLAGPQLKVSLAGEGMISHGTAYPYALFSTPLLGAKGTITIPTAVLEGGGTYLVWLDLRPDDPTSYQDRSDAAFVRVESMTNEIRPAAPLIAVPGSGLAAGHSIDVPFQSSFSVLYDVSNVPGASGAIVEISAPAPGWHLGEVPGIPYTFDNPNGDRIDHDGVDTGSLYERTVPGVRGTVTIDPRSIALPAASYVNIRVLPSSGGRVVGESSDADTILYHGIDPIVAPVFNTYLNPSGTDGSATSTAEVDTYDSPIGIFEQFDLGDPAHISVPFAGVDFFNVSPIIQDDLELVMALPPGGGSAAFYRDVPFATTGYFTQMTLPIAPPSVAMYPEAISPQSSASAAALLYADLNSGATYVTRGNFASGTAFAPSVDISSLIPASADYGYIFTLVYDPTLDRAYVLTEDTSLACSQQSPSLVTVDFRTGKATASPLPGVLAGVMRQSAYALRLDPSTHRLVISASCLMPDDSVVSQLNVMDLDSGAVHRLMQHVESGDQDGAHGYPAVLGDDAQTAVDPVHGLILQRSVFCPTALSVNDEHARVCLNEYAESGALVKVIPGLFPDGHFESQVDSINFGSRRGAEPSLEETGFSLLYDAIQPYSY